MKFGIRRYAKTNTHTVKLVEPLRTADASGKKDVMKCYSEKTRFRDTKRNTKKQTEGKTRKYELET